ncbi:DUF4259 domain-containing protein [Paeniglutamicibacter sp.]|uniref:DUF4259 domain-containing protein n=1 Tax=Paeniglutamicibacter sp. TaxID=1934391 RepID=UPI0039899B39
MGAWDVSVFSNDDAADFGYEFDDANTATEVASVIDAALDAVLGSSDDVDGSDGAAGLAAAALVVAWNEPEMLQDDENYAPQPWPRSPDPLPDHLAAKAAAVLDRMKDPEENELGELWMESGQWEDFTAEISRWRARLLTSMPRGDSPGNTRNGPSPCPVEVPL